MYKRYVLKSFSKNAQVTVLLHLIPLGFTPEVETPQRVRWTTTINLSWLVKGLLGKFTKADESFPVR